MLTVLSFNIKVKFKTADNETPPRYSVQFWWHCGCCV